MSEFTIDGILLPAGLLSARPAASSVAKGTLYPATDTLLIYQSDGVSTWSTWATLTGSGMTNPMTTKGDIILGDTGGAPTRLAAGTSGFGFVSNGASAFPSWQALGTEHGALAHNSTNLAMSTSGEANLTMDTNDLDSDGYHSTSVNTQRFTIPAGLGGVYAVVVCVRIDTATTSAYIAVRKNGTSLFMLLPGGYASVLSVACITGTAMISLAAGDYIECKQIAQNAGNIQSSQPGWIGLMKIDKAG